MFATLTQRNESSALPLRSYTAPAAVIPIRTVSTPLPSRLFRAAIASSGKLVAAGSEDGKAWVWDLATGRRIASLLNAHASVRDVAFVRNDGSLAFAGGNWLRREGTLRLWNLQNSGADEVLWNHNRPITALAISPDQNQLIAASGDGLIRGWNLTNNSELPAIQAHDDEITALAFSADGDTIASAGADQIVRFWNPQLRLRHSLRGHERVVRAIAFAPDGRSLASIDDQTVLLWDAATGRIIQRREAPSGTFRGVVFSSDGDALITAGSSQPIPSEVRLWNLSESTGKIIRRQQSQLTSLMVSPDGTKIAATDDRGSVQLWSEF